MEVSRLQRAIAYAAQAWPRESGVGARCRSIRPFWARVADLPGLDAVQTRLASPDSFRSAIAGEEHPDPPRGSRPNPLAAVPHPVPGLHDEVPHAAAHPARRLELEDGVVDKGLQLGGGAA
jgi:hypothetical protein